MAALVAVGLLGCGASASAAVIFSCMVSATGINFGVYSPLNGAADTATGSWSVTCTASGSGSATVSGTLSLSTGLSGRYSSRTMRSSANVLNYNIFLDPSYTAVFGDGTAGTYAPSQSGTITAGQVYQVNGNTYGFAPPLQDVAAGSYADTIVMTVTY